MKKEVATGPNNHKDDEVDGWNIVENKSIQIQSISNLLNKFNRLRVFFSVSSHSVGNQ